MVPVDDAFVDGGMVWRYVLPCMLTLGPMVFAGVIFARSFRDEVNPDHALGFNIAGSVVGGLTEPFSTVLGFRHCLSWRSAIMACQSGRLRYVANSLNRSGQPAANPGGLNFELIDQLCGGWVPATNGSRALTQLTKSPVFLVV